MRIKRVCALLSALAVLLLLCGCSEKSSGYPSPKEGAYAHDFADILNQSTIENIDKQGKALEDSTTAQVVVVTVESLDGQTVEEYALGLGREWGVGDEDKNNGIVILLSEEDREIRIEVGYGLEGALTDGKTGRIIDDYIGYLSDDDYSTALLGIYNTVINEVYAEYGITPPEQDTLVSPYEDETDAVTLSFVGIIIIIVVIVLIFGGRGHRGGMFIFGGPRFFGGFGGGSSSSGFGGFKGGGGSFGGGGASRKF